MVQSDNVLELLTQTLYPPIDDIALIMTHKKLLETTIKWSSVGILIDEKQKATIILMLDDNNVLAVLRMCLSINDSVRAIEELSSPDKIIFFGCYQGHQFTQEQIRSRDEIERIWKRIPDQITKFTTNDIYSFFKRTEESSKIVGRGKSLGVETKRKVMQDSHGRCMFEGCGEDLGLDNLTGTEGNFSYLVHNIASSENAARSVPVLSDKLSNDANNILLMCDKHHRLIDKVSAVDYPAERLSNMRKNFCHTASRLLKGLSYQPIKAFSVLWPVHRQVIAAPSELQVAQCLAKINARLDSQVNDISDNEAILREMDPAIIKSLTPGTIELAAEKLIMQTKSSRHKAALFAFGLMPSLIALGAKIGNKSEIIPMLRYRDGGQWIWPLDKPNGQFYTVDGLERLSTTEPNIILHLAITAKPRQFDTISFEFNKTDNIKTITVRAFDDVMGNGALGHPQDGFLFMKDMQKLLHDLKNNHGAQRVHLLPCASNAACIFFGKAFDSHHPDILIYDFEGDTMSPQLLIANDNNKCVISNHN